MANIYDKLMVDIDYNKAVEYLVNLGSITRADKILELGCGTGNITIPMAKLGYDIIGVDISEDMLAKAWEKVRDHNLDILLIHQDARALDMGSKKFDIVIFPFDGLNNNLNDEDIIKISDNVYKALNSGGRFLFDINSYYKISRYLGNKSFNSIEDDICYIWNSTFDGKKKVGIWDIVFFVKEGPFYRRFEETHYQRAYKIEEIIKCLKEAGFDRVECFSWSTDKSPDDKCLRIQFCAYK